MLKLPWGVQWELARFQDSLFNKDKDPDQLQDLDNILMSFHGQRNHVAAPKITKLAKGNLSKDDERILSLENEVRVSPHSRCLWSFAPLKHYDLAQNPWRELDIEEHALKKSPFGCLGCNENDSKLDLTDVGADSPTWYGGKVNFAATLVKSEREFSISLDKPYLSSSSRFYRRFGSSRFIRVSIPDEIIYNSGPAVIKYLQSPVIIWNRVFRAFYHKDQTVFLFQTDETYQGGMVVSPDNESPSGHSFLDFLSWHNDLEVNYNQVQLLNFVYMSVLIYCFCSQ